MTVATDLATATGKRRRFYLRIAGQKTVFWQKNDEPDFDGSDVGADPPGAHPITPFSEFLFRCDELNASADLFDEVGKHTGTLATGTAATTTGQVNGRARNLASDRFDLVGGNLIAPSSYTLALWYKSTIDDTQDRAIVIRDSNSTSDPAILLRINNAVVYFEGRFAGPTTFSISQGSVTVASGWHHFVCTFDGDTATLYHNGASSGTSTGHAGKTIDYDVTSTGAFSVGGDAATIFDFATGHIDDVAFYSGKAYGAEWVRRCYNDAITFGRSGLNCLRPNIQHSAGIDLGTMATSLDAIDFVLDDIRDPVDRSTSYFGKLFAPGRWEASSNEYTTVRRSADTDLQLDSDATTIPVQNASGFAAAGEAYLNGECFSYTGKSTATRNLTETLDTFTGVVRGIWPAFANPSATGRESFAEALLYSAKDDKAAGDVGDGWIVSTVPFGSLIGQHVGLYVTTWDTATRAWNAGSLCWAGRVGDTVKYLPSQSCWQLTCGSILGDLDRSLGHDLPVGELGRAINLNGSAATRKFALLERDATGAYVQQCNVTVTAGYYRAFELAHHIAAQLNKASNWSSAKSPVFAAVVDGYGTKFSAWRFCLRALQRWQYTWNHADGGEIPYPLLALGIKPGTTTPVVDKDVAVAGGGIAEVDIEPYVAFQPIPLAANGGKMLIKETAGARKFWADQGTGEAWIVVAPEGRDGDGGSDDAQQNNTLFAYTSKAPVVYASAGFGGLELTISFHNTIGGNTFVGSKIEGESIPAYQVVSLGGFSAGPIDPMRSLLNMLASSGSGGSYNGTYDASVAQCSVGVPASLIDHQSFLDVDTWIRGAYYDAAVTKRHYYLVDKDGISWRDLFQREAGLYGLALVWANGKLRVRRLFALDRASSVATLSDSNFAFPDEKPEIQASIGTVINTRCVSYNWHRGEGKYLANATIVDQVSRSGLRVTKERKIEHPGLRMLSPAVASETFTKLFLNESEALRFPWFTMSRSVAPTLFNVIAIGDIVTLTTSYALPDPMGTGSYATSTRALILNLKWNLQAGFGTVDLLVMHPDPFTPWAPSAEITGWNAGTKTLTIAADTFKRTGDSNDALAFEAGDEIKIFQRWTYSTAVPPVAESGPYNGVVASVTGTTIVLEAGHTVDFDGLMNTTKYTYHATFDDWSAVGASQHSRGLWGADITDHLLGTDDRAQRWGS